MTQEGRFFPSLSITSFRGPGRQPSPRHPSDNWDPSLRVRGWTGFMDPSCHRGRGVERAVQGFELVYGASVLREIRFRTKY